MISARPSTGDTIRNMNGSFDFTEPSALGHVLNSGMAYYGVDRQDRAEMLHRQPDSAILSSSTSQSCKAARISHSALNFGPRYIDKVSTMQTRAGLAIAENIWSRL